MDWEKRVEAVSVSNSLKSRILGCVLINFIWCFSAEEDSITSNEQRTNPAVISLVFEGLVDSIPRHFERITIAGGCRKILNSDRWGLHVKVKVFYLLIGIQSILLFSYLFSYSKINIWSINNNDVSRQLRMRSCVASVPIYIIFHSWTFVFPGHSWSMHNASLYEQITPQ